MIRNACEQHLARWDAVQAELVAFDPAPPVPHDATCSGCRWWDKRELDGYTNLRHSRECHRHCPAMEWPMTKDDDCCGDWEPKGGDELAKKAFIDTVDQALDAIGCIKVKGGE